jgi:hypothetical protein
MLALELARKLYPEPKRRGHKNKWTPLIRAVLVVEVERRIEKATLKDHSKPFVMNFRKENPGRVLLMRKKMT